VEQLGKRALQTTETSTNQKKKSTKKEETGKQWAWKPSKSDFRSERWAVTGGLSIRCSLLWKLDYYAMPHPAFKIQRSTFKIPLATCHV